jgi:hypothetical protein
MAKKVILMKLLQEIRGYANVTNRRPTPATPMLYLMQLRRRNAHAHTQVRVPQPLKRLAITANWQNPGEAPAPIKIHHAVANPSEMPVVIG